MLVNARSAADVSGSAAIAWQTPAEDADSPSDGCPGVPDPAPAGEQALNTSAIERRIQRHGARDDRNEGPTVGRSDIPAQYLCSGDTLNLSELQASGRAER